MEIFNLSRPVSAMLAGNTLRIVDQERFKMVYTLDDWATTQTMDSRSVGHAGSFADIATAADQTEKIVFTLAWPVEGQGDRWLGRNIEVTIVPYPESGR
jgi:glucoamylase